MSKIKVYMGNPSMGERSDHQCYTLRTLEKKYGDRIEFIYPEYFVGRMFHDYARNEYVKDFIKSGADILWFLDADIDPPANVLDIVTNPTQEWQLAGAPYPVWMVPNGSNIKEIVFCAYLRDATGMHAARVPTTGTGLVDGLATGCLFIKREVIDKMTEPYFEFKYNDKTRYMERGEDFDFCLKASDLGYKFYVDFEKPCHHYKKISLLEVSDYIMKMQQQAILATDRSMRQVLAKMKLKQMDKPVKSSLILP